jgi:hypothetical protein
MPMSLRGYLQSLTAWNATRRDEARLFKIITSEFARQQFVVQDLIQPVLAMNGRLERGEEEEQKEGIPISTVTRRHFQLQIHTLQNAPRDVEKLEEIIKSKEREKERATHFMY